MYFIFRGLDKTKSWEHIVLSAFKWSHAANITTTKTKHNKPQSVMSGKLRERKGENRTAGETEEKKHKNISDSIRQKMVVFISLYFYSRILNNNY